MPAVFGLDLSLTSTGVAAIFADGSLVVDRVASAGRKDASLSEQTRRMVDLTEKITAPIIEVGADLVVIESALFSVAEADSSAHRRAGLWWAVAAALDAADIPVGHIAPTTLKKWATGSGKADKQRMLRALDTDWPGHTARSAGKYDMADAAYLAAIAQLALDRPLPARAGANAYRTQVCTRMLAESSYRR